MSKIPTHHVFQKADDNNCGLACLEMVYKMNGINRTVADLLKDFHLQKKGADTYPAQLARDLEKHGLKTKLIISNPRIISKAWVKLDKKELIENIKTWLTLHPKSDWHTSGMHVLFYLQEGGIVEMDSYHAQTVKTLLDNQSTLILCVDEAWIYGHRFSENKAEVDDVKGETHGHFVIITGYTHNMVSVLDPYPTGLKDFHGSYMVDIHTVVNASLIWAGTILQILPASAHNKV